MKGEITSLWTYLLLSAGCILALAESNKIICAPLSLKMDIDINQHDLALLLLAENSSPLKRRLDQIHHKIVICPEVSAITQISSPTLFTLS